MKELLLLTYMLYVSALLASVRADHTDLCQVLKDGTQFRRPDTCNEYITCYNQTGSFQRCPSPLEYDRNRKTCVEKVSDCQRNYCADVNGKWVANPNNCHGFFYCNSSVAFAGGCPMGLHFVESQQSCVYDTESGCNEVPNICNFLPDLTMFRDETDCTVYYQCRNGEKKKNICKNTYFDVSKSACVGKTLVACKSHPVPSNVCGTPNRPKSGFATDAVTCRGFFYCRDMGVVQDLQPVWGQCLEGTFFNTTTSACVDPVNAYCTYNRCEGRGNRFVVSSRNNCRNYIVCKGGVELEEKSCSGDKFFDEHMQACVHLVIRYPCCDGKK